MNLHTQLYLGNLGNQLGYGYGIFLILICLPMIIWLIVSLIRWVISRKIALLKWWAITAGVLSTVGLIILAFAKILGGAAYTIASRTNIYIPRSVDVLENDHLVAMDEEQDYVVVRFNQTQMDTFMKSAKDKGWKSGTVVPYSLLNLSPGQENPMSGRKNPLPKVKRDGYYYSFIKTRYEYQDSYTTRKAYFLDTKSRTLYIFYDDSQWG
ncbi:hypothetical protein [Alicyclobacillus shizuokensis]|uniref:hypothetical protein n=1 Tax=Alicyclobacillus shizuokensis TaxID=392014 RepID=UPI000836F5BA|nr:hypothetical protein [Alicyclobacillus shizuokensis]